MGEAALQSHGISKSISKNLKIYSRPEKVYDPKVPNRGNEKPPNSNQKHLQVM